MRILLKKLVRDNSDNIYVLVWIGFGLQTQVRIQIGRTEIKKFRAEVGYNLFIRCSAVNAYMQIIATPFDYIDLHHFVAALALLGFCIFPFSLSEY